MLTIGYLEEGTAGERKTRRNYRKRDTEGDVI